MKPPTKPLSPYIFFSQEKRKEIKREPGNEHLNAKQVMKLVSRKWQLVKDDKEITERYEYLSLRDREAYAELKKYWDKLNAAQAGSGEESSLKKRGGRSRFGSYD